MNLRGAVKGDALEGIIDFGEGTTDVFSTKRVAKKDG